MKKFLKAMFFLSLLLMPVFLLAQSSASSVSSAASTVTAALENPPTGDELQKFLESLGGLKGMGILAVVALIVQGLMLLLRSAAGELLGKWRLLILTLLTVVGGLVGLHAAGMDWSAALVQGSSLAALQVFLHQLYTQFIEKPKA